MYEKKDKSSHKELHPIDSNIVNNYDTVFSFERFCGIGTLSGFKRLVSEMFLVFQNEQLVEGLDNLRKESLKNFNFQNTSRKFLTKLQISLAKIITSKTRSQTQSSQWKIASFFIKTLFREIRTTKIHLSVKNYESNTEIIDNFTEEKVYRNCKVGRRVKLQDNRISMVVTHNFPKS